MSQDLISIIVPAYNIEDYIDRAVESIRAQTYQNLEIILVDDGSVDDTLAKLEQLAKKDIRIKVLHKDNGGVTSARLAGVKASAGEWIGFVDGDDFIESEMYEHLIKNAKEYSADISHCGYQMVFPKHIDYYYNTGCFVEQDKICGIKDLLTGAFIEPGLCNKLFHKKLFNSLLHENKMPLDIKINEDLLMNYWLFKDAKFSIYEDFCPYHYVLRNGSAATSNVNENKLKDPIKVTKIILNDIGEESSLKEAIWNKLLRQYINLATMPFANNKDIIRPHKQRALNELKSLRRFVWKELNIGLKTKLMVIWVSVSPKSYEWVHEIYSKLSGHNKKYSIEN